MKQLATRLVTIAAISTFTGCGAGASGFFLHDVDAWAADDEGRLSYRARVDDVVVPEGLEDPSRLTWEWLVDRVDRVSAIQVEGASLSLTDDARDPTGVLADETFTLELVLPPDEVIVRVPGALDHGPADDTEAVSSVRFSGLDTDLAALDERIALGEFDVRLIADRPLDPGDLPELELLLSFFVEGPVRRDE